MSAGDKFLALLAVVFSITVVYSVSFGAALAEALVLLVLLGIAARRIDRP